MVGHCLAVGAAVGALQARQGSERQIFVLPYGRGTASGLSANNVFVVTLPQFGGGFIGALRAVPWVRGLRRVDFGDAYLAQPGLSVSRGRGPLIALPFIVGARRVRAIDPGTGCTSRTFSRSLALAELLRFLVLAGFSLLAARTAAALLNRADGPSTAPGPLPARGQVLYLRTDVELAQTPLRIGGSQAHTEGILGALEDRGYEVEVMTTGYVAGRAERLEARRLPALLGGNVPREMSELAAGLVQYLQLRGGPAPALIYQRYSLNNLAGALLSARWQVPLVLEVNGSEVKWRREWSTLQFGALAEATERFILRRSDRIGAVSDNVARDLGPAGAHAARVRVIPNGVEVDRFAEAPAASLPFSPGAFVIGFAGLFYPWHGVHILAEAFVLLRREHPAARLVLVGDGEEREAAAKVLDGAGASEDVLFTGLVPRNAIPGYLAALDVLVSPHVPNDDFIGSPIKIWEYMAAGRAIVASDVAQLAQVLKHDDTALIVPAGDPQALADALGRLHDSPELRARLGGAARAEAVAEHSWKARLEELMGEGG